MRAFHLVFLLTLLLTLPLDAAGQDLIPRVPKAVLMDFSTGRILYQKNPDAPNPPASLTKLMTLHLAWKALETGKVKTGDLVPITPETTGKSLAPDSSLMYLEPGQIVTFQELMLGLAVDSGNDAGLTLGVFLGGSEDSFVKGMNDEALRLGLRQTIFFDSYGISEKNTTTAREFAEFCRMYLQQHPSAIALLHSVREFAFPLASNWPADHRGAVHTFLQPNRNSLLFSYPGADGLKTGYIQESGYNLAATALRKQQRLIAVLLGIQAASTSEGSRVRSQSAAALLDFGFQNYPLRPLPLPALPSVKVWYTREEVIQLKGQEENYPLTEAEALRLTTSLEVPREVLGPFPVQTALGQVTWSLDGKPIARTFLVSQNPVNEAGFLERLWQSIVLFFQGLFGHKPPVDLTVKT